MINIITKDQYMDYMEILIYKIKMLVNRIQDDIKENHPKLDKTVPYFKTKDQHSLCAFTKIKYLTYLKTFVETHDIYKEKREDITKLWEEVSDMYKIEGDNNYWYSS